MSFTHQDGNVGTASASATVAVTLAANPGTGDLVCVGISAFNATLNTLNSVQDQNGNTYAIVAAGPSSAQNATAGSVWHAYLLSAPANAHKTITATFSAANTSAQIWADRFSVTLPTTFDSAIVGSGTNATTGLGSPTFNPAGLIELVYGTACASNNIVTCGNWTQSGGAVTSGNDSAYVIGGGISQIGMLSWTLSGTNNYDSIIMGFSQNPVITAPVTTDLVQGGGISTLPSAESVSASGQFQIRLANKTLAGNCLVLGLAYSTTNAPTVTVTDDGGNTWNPIVTTTDTTNHIAVALYLALNVAAGTRVINVSPSAATNFVSAGYAEFANVPASLATDGSIGTFSATGTAVAPGSFTPGQNGDKIIQFAFASQNKLTGGWTPQSGFTLISADAGDGSALQYQIQPTAAAINPTLTQVIPNGFTTNGWATVAMALKTSPAGSLPAPGIHVDRVQHVNTNQEVSAGVGFQMPSSGNLLVLSLVCSSPWTIASMTDSAGNIWQQVGNPVVNSSNCQIWFAANASPGDLLVVKCNMTGQKATGHGGTFMAHSISGASSNPLDTGFGISGQASATGNDTTSGANPVQTLTATPSGVNELIIFNVGIDFDTATSLTTPVNAFFLSTTFSGQPEPSHSDENNVFALYYNGSDLSPETLAFLHNQIDQTGVGNWAAIAAAFQAPASTALNGVQIDPTYTSQDLVQRVPTQSGGLY